MHINMHIHMLIVYTTYTCIHTEYHSYTHQEYTYPCIDRIYAHLHARDTHS